jgi:predicted dienelactone hydrolase
MNHACRFCLLLCALLLAPLARAADYTVGYREIWVRDDVTATAYPVMLWYPSTGAGVTARVRGYLLDVAADGAPAPGRYGLIAISHGAEGNPMNQRGLAMALVRSGFAVAAPKHSLANDIAGFGDPAQLAGRPAQLRAAINAALADAALGPHLDPNRIGAVGYSAGGYTVLAALGAEPSRLRVWWHCLVHHDDDAVFCGERRPHTGPEWPGPSLRAEHVVRVSGRQAPAIRAAVLEAPAAVMFGESQLDTIDVPVRLYAARDDKALRPAFHAQPVREALEGGGTVFEYVEIADAVHYSFVTPAETPQNAAAGTLYYDKPGFDRAALHEKLNREIPGFFMRTLGGR